MLEETGHVFLITGETIESFGYDDFEFAGAGVFQELLVSGPEPAGPAAGSITIGTPKLPALALDPLPTDPDLVLDRGLALKVGRIAGIDHGAHGCLQRFRRDQPEVQVAAACVWRHWYA